MYFCEDSTVTDAYWNDDDEEYTWKVFLTYDADRDFLSAEWEGCPKGCSKEHFDKVMSDFNSTHFNVPSYVVDEAFTTLAKEEGWE